MADEDPLAKSDSTAPEVARHATAAPLVVRPRNPVEIAFFSGVGLFVAYSLKVAPWQWRRHAPEFLREASVLIAVFALLDVHLANKQITASYFLKVILFALFCFGAGNAVEAILGGGLSWEVRP